jgi:hypothetical protein
MRCLKKPVPLAGQIADAGPLHANWTGAWHRFEGLPELFDVTATQRHPIQRVTPVTLGPSFLLLAGGGDAFLNVFQRRGAVAKVKESENLQMEIWTGSEGLQNPHTSSCHPVDRKRGRRSFCLLRLMRQMLAGLLSKGFIKKGGLTFLRMKTLRP